MVTGSGGIAIAEHLGVEFIQEMMQAQKRLEATVQTDVAIELVAKIKLIYFRGGIDQRMNRICAGGTGHLAKPDGDLIRNRCRWLK